LALLAAGAVGLVLVSGGSSADPRTPAGLPGLAPPFLGTTVVGDGGLTAAIDAYGDVVDLRAPGPAGRALIDNPADRQAAGSVPANTGIVPRVRIDGGAALPIWRASSVSQHYLQDTNVVRTLARFGRVRVVITDAAEGGDLARRMAVSSPAGVRVVPRLGVNVEAGARCERERRARGIDLVCSPRGAAPRGGVGERAELTLRAATEGDRGWLNGARPLGPGAPPWASEMYRRSLLTLRALTDGRSGAVAAGARDGWAYVWPRDAATAALAFSAAGYRSEAPRVTRFLLGLKLEAGARFRGDGTAVRGRGAQGDAAGWVALAAGATGARPRDVAPQWHDRPDYQEGSPGDYLGNAIASTSADGPKTRLYEGKSARRRASAAIARDFGGARGLARAAQDASSGLDAAAAWAVRPFSLPALYPEVRETLLRLAARQTPFGITPGEGWTGGSDPWTAPTAWTAWSLAALGERRQALRLLGDLRRAATPAGTLPERVDARTGVPRSTTPLAWSHAFAILALRQLWPGR
jgi:hypothetical protein